MNKTKTERGSAPLVPCEKKKPPQREKKKTRCGVLKRLQFFSYQDWNALDRLDGIGQDRYSEIHMILDKKRNEEKERKGGSAEVYVCSGFPILD